MCAMSAGQLVAAVGRHRGATWPGYARVRATPRAHTRMAVYACSHYRRTLVSACALFSRRARYFARNDALRPLFLLHRYCHLPNEKFRANLRIFRSLVASRNSPSVAFPTTWLVSTAPYLLFFFFPRAEPSTRCSFTRNQRRALVRTDGGRPATRGVKRRGGGVEP